MSTAAAGVALERLERQALPLDASVLRLTLLTILLYSSVGEWASTIAGMLALIMLMSPRYIRSATLWFILSGITAEAALLEWDVIDNHQYLLVYWTLSISTMVAFPDLRPLLPGVAKALIGCTFALATLWKVRSTDFLSGSFWEAQILLDQRLHLFSQALLDVPSTSILHNTEVERRFRDSLVDVESLELLTTPTVERLAIWMGWAGFAIEAIVAFVFLVPRALITDRIRVLMILAFVFIYVLLPVIGFAWVLLAMTLAHLSSDDRVSRHALLLTVPLAWAGNTLAEILLGLWAGL